MVGPFCFAFIWFKVQGSRFRVLVAALPPFFIGAMPGSGILVTSHSYDTREEIVSHVRLSRLFYWAMLEVVF